MEDVLLFGLGVALIIVELLFIPGFGAVGMAGILIVLWALLNAMIERLPGVPWVPSWPQLEVPIMKLGLSLLLTLVGGIAMGRYLPRTSIFQRLVLAESTSRDHGYTASRSTDDLVGQEGTALNDLHPAGAGQFGERRLDVITRGEYLSARTPIRIAETHGSRIIVEECERS